MLFSVALIEEGKFKSRQDNFMANSLPFKCKLKISLAEHLISQLQPDVMVMMSGMTTALKTFQTEN